MNTAHMIGIALQLSMALIICCVALESNFGDFMYLWRRPGLLARSLLSMLVVMPVAAVLISIWFDLNHTVEIALLASALSPVPPILPNKQIKAGGDAAYVIGLLTTTALVAVVYIPLAGLALQHIFHRPVDVQEAHVIKIVLTSMLLPAVVGMALHEWAPGFAKRIQKPLSFAATVVLVVACIPIIAMEWPTMGRIAGHFSIVVMIGFTVLGLLVGHLLGGPNMEGRSVLALATASRHPAVALAISHNAMDKPGVMAAVLMTLLVGTAISVPYVRWHQRMHSLQLAPTRGHER